MQCIILLNILLNLRKLKHKKTCSPNAQIADSDLEAFNSTFLDTLEPRKDREFSHLQAETYNHK